MLSRPTYGRIPPKVPLRQRRIHYCHEILKLPASKKPSSRGKLELHRGYCSLEQAAVWLFAIQ